MPTMEQTNDIVEKINNYLTSPQYKDTPLKVDGEKLDDGWLYITVVPSIPGVRASEYARNMSQIESQLRKEGHENVLLVPALED